jgi:hypothetical protein
MRKYKRTHRKMYKKNSRNRRTRKTRKIRKNWFNKIGGNRACLDALQAKYGQVFWTGGITIQQIYDDALNIRSPEVIQLIREVRARIPIIKSSMKGAVYSPPNKAELSRLICAELNKITNMLGEERSAIIMRTTLRYCGKFYGGGILGEYNSPHYNFLLEYLDCLINIMEFSLLQAPAQGGLPEEQIQEQAPGGPVPGAPAQEPIAQLEPPAPGAPGWVP